MLLLKDITIGYPGKILASGINLTIKEGDIFLLEGPNGSGKSTLGRVILGELKPIAGIRQNSFSKISYVPQKSAIDTRYPISLEVLVSYGLAYGWFSLFKPVDKTRIAEALARVGLAHLGQLLVSSASGGQLQRALIARALVSYPQFILLDEPFSNLDIKGREDIAKLLIKLNQQHKTTLFVIDHQRVATFPMAQKLLLENGQLRFL